jgi:hypothetical protein
MAVVQASGTTYLEGIAPVSLNDLLTWMSVRGSGSWSQFRAAVEELHVEPGDTEEAGEQADDATAGDLPVYQSVRLGLQRLAHVEFYSSTAEADWRVVPPALAVHQEGDQWVGILCGARPPGLRHRIGSGTVTWESQAVPGMPDRIRLVAPDLATLETASKGAGVHIQANAPESLFAAIPPVDDPRSRVPAKAPVAPGWTIEKFLTSTLRWTARDPTNERDLESRDVDGCRTGLFRFRLKHQRFHYLRWRGKMYSVGVQVGKYAILWHRRVRRSLEYDPSRSLLLVPVTCRPPLLIERGLILCSGLLPSLDRATRHLQYAVPRSVARLASGLLRQEIRIP